MIENVNRPTNCAVGVSPWYMRRWWLKGREVTPIRYADGTVGGCGELYVPLWAWPLELLHRAIFGRVHLKG